MRSDISSNVYLDFDTYYFKVDTSNNLQLSDTFWKKDASNNLYYTSGKIGTGVTSPGANYALDVLNHMDCAEIYRNDTPISSTLSLFLPSTGGTLTGAFFRFWGLVNFLKCYKCIGGHIIDFKRWNRRGNFLRLFYR